ncbi:DUF3060 domain-containing protein [Mycolicibacterium duvalii]|nr:DUF3060 domain-containing protein [Mycolicibacterium duvalii]MCV7367788.1 DUF3060 domain-containing protein [Mycolicibacterium duvalii]
MEPDADPEARIRDLERPLAERARASELGTQPYPTSAGVPVPPPAPYPQSFGESPYYAPPQRVVHKRSASTALWLVPVVVGVVVVATAIVAVAFFVTSAPEVSAPRPGIAGGGGSIDAPEVPAAPVAPGLGVDPGERLVTVGPGASVSLGGVESERTVRCDGGTVSVSGVRNVVDVQGPCAGIVVSGVDNIVTVETAETITASGLDNQITYRTGAPEVSRSGSRNIVEQRPVGGTP